MTTSSVLVPDLTMAQLIVVLPVVPVVSALFIHLLSKRLGARAARVSVTATALTFAVALALLGWAIAGHGAQQIHVAGWSVLLFDPLSTLMATVVSGISLIVHVYSVRYMAEEAGYVRYFVLLDLMTAALLTMVAAGDLLTLLIAWHLIGVLLYFLLGHNTQSASSSRYASWTFLTYRFGDLPLVVAAGLLYHAYGTWSLPEIFAQLGQNPQATTLGGQPLADVVAALVALAAFARSAQFLLHTWLPYTMEGPTPVSALMHAGIVNAGGFLVNRMAPLFVHTGGVLHWLFVVGLVTAVVGSVLMLTQNDIKKSLGYSTMGQMGFMIMECGVGAFSLAIYHLIAHGVFKGTLFLSAGSVIGEARHDDRVPKEDLYTFVVERRPARRRAPWILMAGITLLAPAIILILAHWLVAEDIFQQQGAVVLLFFGWITGAQLIFATYRMRTESFWRLISLTVISLAVVVLGYAAISHAFDLFLYPDPAFRAQIYAAADISILRFDVLVAVVTAVIVLGWVLAYYSERNGSRAARTPGGLWMNFYALISREIYVTDLYAWLARAILSAATRLNARLRWA